MAHWLLHIHDGEYDDLHEAARRGLHGRAGALGGAVWWTSPGVALLVDEDRGVHCIDTLRRARHLILSHRDASGRALGAQLHLEHVAARWRAVVRRDAMGLVPLVLVALPGRAGWCVSTDAAWALRVAGRRAEVRRDRLRRYLLHEDDAQDRDDFFEGVLRLRPGDVLSCTPGSVSLQSAPDLAGASAGEATASGFAEALRAAMEPAPDLATTPRVLAMSGGLDSPTLAALECARVGASAARPLHVASKVFPGLAGSDESDAIAQIAAALPLDVQRVPLDAVWPLQREARPMYAEAEHLAWGPQFHPGEHHDAVFWRAVRARHAVDGEEGVPLVGVTGVGADQLLYTTGAEAIRAALRRGDREALRGYLRHRPRALARQSAALLASQLGVDAPLRAGLATARAWWRGASTPASGDTPDPWTEPARWVPGARREGAGDALLPHHYLPLPTRKLRLMRSWRWELSARMMLRHQTRVGVRLVHPYLDPALWRLTLDMSPDLLWRGGRDKLPLRQVAEMILPRTIAWAPKHSSFDRIVERGLGVRERAFTESLLAEPLLADLGLLDVDAFRVYYHQYADACLRGHLRVVRSSAVWRVISAELWLRGLDSAR